MKILQLVQKPQRRGAEVFASQLSAELCTLNHSVMTAYLYPYLGETPLALLPSDLILSGEERHVFESVPGYHPHLLGQLCGVIEEFKPDIVQVNGARTVKYGAFAKRRMAKSWKLVYRNIGNPSHWVSDPLRLWFYRNRVGPQLDGIVGVSQATLESVRRTYAVDRPAVYIPNGIALGPLTGLATREEVRHQLGVAQDAPILLYIGNLNQEKRPDRFLRIVGNVAKHYPNVQAWILGGGALRQSLEAQVEREQLEELVTFWGYQEEVGRFIVAADLLLVTSDSEGIPAVVLEAGYLGKAVVATQVGGMAECVVDGETGLLVAPEDEDGLTSATRQLLDDEELRSRMGRKATTWIVNHFAMNQIAHQYEEFYAQMLEEAGGRRLQRSS